MNKKFYWLKLKEDFFDDDAINWLEEQQNGTVYSLFYLKLCLKSLKSNGILIRSVGEMLIPYDAKKLSEITHTPHDAVIIAMQLLQKIGLVKILENGEIYITRLADMVGSETSKAAIMRKSREKKALESKSGNNVTKMLPDNGNIVDTEIENRDRDRDRDRDNPDFSSEKSPKRKRFIKPTIEEIAEYCKERRNNIDPEKFYDYYESNGWKIGKNHMKDFKAAIRTWEKNDFESKSTQNKPKSYQYGEVI